MNTTKRAIPLLVICLLISLPAGADSITYVLTQSNLGASFTGPFASVTIGWSGNNPSSTANVTFESLVSGGNIYLMGDGASVALNVNGPWAIDACAIGNNPPDCGAIAGSNSRSGFTPGPYQLLPPGNVSDFGTFDLFVKSFDGFTHSATEISFTLTNTGGNWADAASVLTPNSEGQIAAIHAFACIDAPDPCTSSDDAIKTGYAGGAVAVPEPASLTLLGTGLLGGFLRRRNFFGRH